MMKILHVICSPRGQESESQKLSRKIIGFLLQRDPTAIVIDRVIGGGVLLHIDDSYATALGATEESSAEGCPKGSMSQSDELIRELESSDCVVIATPMHNFTVPSTLKAWIDHVVRVRRTFRSTPDGYVGLAPGSTGLRGRIVRRTIFRSTGASAGFFDALSPSQPRYNRAERPNVLCRRGHGARA